MIGVWVQDIDRPVVEELFELFKTPWEFGRPGRRYDVALCGDGFTPAVPAAVVLLAGPSPHPDDPTSVHHPSFVDEPSGIRGQSGPLLLQTRGGPLPIYTGCRLFAVERDDIEMVAGTRDAGPGAVIRRRTAGGTQVRLGYDLFAEIRRLLDGGQPAALAPIASLDRHIGVLRSLILDAGLPLVEIPPVPDGHAFIVCLSHDVDHAGIRHHKADHTLLGFLYRATLGSLINWTRGRLTGRQVLANWAAVASLPAVHLGRARDFWLQFDQYLALENGRPSTFFVIPFPGVAGSRAPDTAAAAPQARAAKYETAALKPDFDRLRAAGCEVALHGLDAWNDAARGKGEAAAIDGLAEASERGVRMHWLYFEAGSPSRLEQAGFTYDSTSGYNEAIGFRAGTSQVFRPPGVAQLLELPLHVMDTALFYPSRMNLAPDDARAAVMALVDEAARHGGVLTINWHDRSLAPERLWDGFYRQLLAALDTRTPWFATAADSVAWFRQRREARIGTAVWENDAVRVTTTAPRRPGLPGMRLRVHPPRSGRCIDVPLEEDTRVVW